jgi:hypothetical protein
VTGDGYLATRSPGCAKEVIGIMGARGNSADCIIHAIIDANVEQGVVWGEVRDDLSKTKAYKIW